jgi:hypothetical protein
VSARFVRQLLVSEIGAAGQAAIESAVVELVAEGLTARVFRAYAEGAGFRAVRVHPPTHYAATPVAAPTGAPTEVLDGARAAVRAITTTLAIPATRGATRAGGT